MVVTNMCDSHLPHLDSHHVCTPFPAIHVFVGTAPYSLLIPMGLWLLLPKIC